MTRTYKSAAVGSTTRSDGTHYRCQRRCVVAFDDETFEQLRKLALKKNASFPEVVRGMVELGLES